MQDAGNHGPKPDALLTRAECAEALTEAGFKTSPATLDTKAVRGGGPPFQKWGNRALYPWGTALEWARGRLSPPVNSTSEFDGGRREIATATTGAGR
jgi:hypothetical protein